jgi:hypothetical protein
MGIDEKKLLCSTLDPRILLRTLTGSESLASELLGCWFASAKIVHGNHHNVTVW